MHLALTAPRELAWAPCEICTNWEALTLPATFQSHELSVVASSDGEDYQSHARWLWKNADPVLEHLFQRTVSPGELPGTSLELHHMPRAVSVLVG